MQESTCTIEKTVWRLLSTRRHSRTRNPSQKADFYGTYLEPVLSAIRLRGRAMKTTTILLLTLAIFFATEQTRSQDLPPQDQPPDAVNMFYADLAPYGEWIVFEPGVYAWHPYVTDPEWRPYTAGHWVWSDYGWYWVSAEPFGWATYHYGRWYLDDFYGWIWVPDPIWGPAWVEWRCNDDYIGWAPLPPYARFHVTVGIRFTQRWVAPAIYWSFVSYNHFDADHPYRNYVPESYTRRLISTTRSAIHYQVDQNRIVDVGVERSFVEQRTKGRITTFEVTPTRDRGVERVTTDGNRERVEIYRPQPGDARTSETRVIARRATTRPSLDLERIERYRSVPQRRGQLVRPGDSRSQGTFEMPMQSKPEIRRENQNRSNFPSPKLERPVPNRQPQSRDEGRTRRR